MLGIGLVSLWKIIRVNPLSNKDSSKDVLFRAIVQRQVKTYWYKPICAWQLMFCLLTGRETFGRQ